MRVSLTMSGGGSGVGQEVRLPMRSKKGIVCSVVDGESVRERGKVS